MKKYKILSFIIGGFLLFYLSCIHFTDPTEIGIRWNSANGLISKDSTAGFHLTPPWVLVAHIRTSPVRVCITSASRSVNCRLAIFIPEYYREFISTEGFRYYWWDNRISFNMGYDEEYRGVKDLLRGYTFGAKEYPFLHVMKDYE